MELQGLEDIPFVRLVTHVLCISNKLDKREIQNGTIVLTVLSSVHCTIGAVGALMDSARPSHPLLLVLAYLPLTLHSHASNFVFQPLS